MQNHAWHLIRAAGHSRDRLNITVSEILMSRGRKHLVSSESTFTASVLSGVG